MASLPRGLAAQRHIVVLGFSGNNFIDLMLLKSLSVLILTRKHSKISRAASGVSLPSRISFW